MSLVNTVREQFPLPEDLRVFLTVVRKQGFSAAADELGLSPAYVSKRINILEKTLKTRLLHRTTRKIALTEDGQHTLRWAQQILGDLDDLINDLSPTQKKPRGLLHICSSFGFGRKHVAPAISLFADSYPELEIRLDVFDRDVDIIGEGFDMEVRVGDDLPKQHICKKLLENSRILCAAPDYLNEFGAPESLEALQDHSCLVLKERNIPFGVWVLSNTENTETVKISGPLSSNNGEIILQWALNNRGIVLRSLWDVKPYLEQGLLVQVLPAYEQKANVWAVYPTRLTHSAKLKAFVEFLAEHFRANPSRYSD